MESYKNEGQVAADVAVNKAYVAANDEWKKEAYIAGIYISKVTKQFTSQDIINAMPHGVSTHEPRAIGAIMRRLQREGIIKATDRYTNLGMAKNHNRPPRIWEST